MKYLTIVVMLFVGLVLQAQQQKVSKNNVNDSIINKSINDSVKVVINIDMVNRFNAAEFDSTKTFDHISSYLREHNFNELKELYVKEEKTK